MKKFGSRGGIPERQTPVVGNFRSYLIRSSRGRAILLYGYTDTHEPYLQ
ncbi:MAG: hypothetical protein ABL933_18605 [Methyloglobulus sp.]|nr:hypothetical protein [Methyloglobulus sp.]